MAAFDWFTQHAPDNPKRRHEAFKTNNSWKVNTKAIGRLWYRHGYGLDSSTIRELDDVDRAMCHVTGKSLENIVRIAAAAYEKTRVEAFGEEFESEFFTGKIFKKGTIHLRFKDLFVWEQFNLAAAKINPSLPNGQNVRGEAV